MVQSLPPDSPTAQALAWRWMRLPLQDREGVEGLTPDMRPWLGEAHVHARCALLAPYLTLAQLAEVRRRHLHGLPHRHAWPALAGELRAQLQAGTDARNPVVQDIARRWQQLFRDSHYGDDAAL